VTDADAIAVSLRDPDRFAVLVERHLDEIFRYAARRIGPSAAEDVVADTFAAAFARRKRYDASYPSALPWLYGIATNLLRRRRRQEERQLHAYARTGLDPVLSGEPDLTERELAGVLAALSPEEREPLLLLAWADLSYEEIARALDVPIGTVRSRLNRARKKLQHSFEAARPRAEEVVNG
jgi:RNA polymerase sigma-70 factor (ECF subfamily)